MLWCKFNSLRQRERGSRDCGVRAERLLWSNCRFVIEESSLIIEPVNVEHSEEERKKAPAGALLFKYLRYELV